MTLVNTVSCPPAFASSQPCLTGRSSWTPQRITTCHAVRRPPETFAKTVPSWHKVRPPVTARDGGSGTSSSSTSSFPTPATPTPLAPPTSDVWELDFYSRPVVGIDGKKLWELIIVDETGTFEYVESVPNTLVNSRELRRRIEEAISMSPNKPRTIRYFRSQMTNMIEIALRDVDVTVSPSRKTYALYRILKQRDATVYSSMPGYKPSLVSSITVSSSSSSSSQFSGLNLSMSKRLPDALRCERFAFGNFPLAQLEQFFNDADPSDYYGDRCPVDDDMSDNITVPGLIVFSRRASTLAAWLNGIELVFIRTLMEKREVALECGLNTVYRFAKITDDLKEDVRNFQKLKTAAKGLHFLAVQESPESEEVEGMWLLCEL